MLRKVAQGQGARKRGCHLALLAYFFFQNKDRSLSENFDVVDFASFYFAVAFEKFCASLKNVHASSWLVHQPVSLHYNLVWFMKIHELEEFSEEIAKIFL